MTVNQAIKTLREHRGMSQQTFATELRMSIASIQNYERGKRPELQQLFTFLAAAERAGRFDLINVLKAEIVYRTGNASWIHLPQTTFENLAVDAFVRFLRRPGAAALVSTALAAIDVGLQLAPTEEERSGLGALLVADNDQKLREEAVRLGYARIIDGRLVWEASAPDAGREQKRSSRGRKSLPESEAKCG